MRPLRLKRLSQYVATLERSGYNIVTPLTLAGVQVDRSGPVIQLVLTNPVNREADEQISQVTHECVHETHGLETLADSAENDKQEVEINRLTDLLCRRPEWNMIVLYWLNNALTDTLLEQTR